MLVDGAGQLKMTKDGKVLLSEMQIQVTNDTFTLTLTPPAWSAPVQPGPGLQLLFSTN